MKQKKRVSIIGTLILIISAVALITGCLQPNGGTITKNIVEFDSARVKCTKTNSYSYTDINNGDQIQENDELLFQAIWLSGKIVKNWYINDVKQEDQTRSLMSYTVKASDIAGGRLKVRFDTKDVVQKPIEFDSTRVTCTKTNTDPYTNINNGDPIQENDELLFKAILPEGKIVKNWYINDVKQEDKTDSTMLYTVKASDIAGGKLKVRFDTKDPVQGTVEFDSSVKCQNTNSYPYTNINTGAPIQENDKLQFEAILPAGKVVENWYINDVKKKYETRSVMRYTVKASDFKSGKIKISVVFK
ncbi:hypothetical protein [Treponema denticola]|uniref:hypothetical protein n=1 Tax=Treponema denticola TaxID=158 RepID=UPI0020A56602|nr:hypothetical protein [Treponema denticola]UTC82311.1 hypothetical protein HGJ18_03495 [Treponema denticola]